MNTRLANANGRIVRERIRVSLREKTSAFDPSFRQVSHNLRELPVEQPKPGGHRCQLALFQAWIRLGYHLHQSPRTAARLSKEQPKPEGLKGLSRGRKPPEGGELQAGVAGAHRALINRRHVLEHPAPVSERPAFRPRTARRVRTVASRPSLVWSRNYRLTPLASIPAGLTGGIAANDAAQPPAKFCRPFGPSQSWRRSDSQSMPTILCTFSFLCISASLCESFFLC